MISVDVRGLQRYDDKTVSGLKSSGVPSSAINDLSMAASKVSSYEKSYENAQSLANRGDISENARNLFKDDVKAQKIQLDNAKKELNELAKKYKLKLK